MAMTENQTKIYALVIVLGFIFIIALSIYITVKHPFLAFILFILS